MSFKPEVLVGGVWSANAVVFNTKAEAETSAQDLFSRWMLCTDWRAVESDLPANYKIVDNAMVAI